MKEMFNAGLAAKITACGNIAVVVIDDAADAVPTARALLEGGVNVMELTVRTAAAARAIRTIPPDVPQMIIGAGTLLTEEQVDGARAAGAAFGVAPGFNAGIVRHAFENGFPFAPGVMTPSEIEGALALGCRIMKLFPASVLGGPKAVKTLTAPYKHLGLRYIPLGGLTADNTAEYLADPSICACGGSWIAPAKLINAHDWNAIAENARKAAAAARSARS